MAEVILKNIGKAYDNGYEAVKNVNIDIIICEADRQSRFDA